MATLLAFTRVRLQDWSNEEKAQLARIQKLLGDAGVTAEIDLGVTDEGDPWCAICSGTSDDVIVHIARLDGKYLFDSAALPTMIQGRSLDDCAQRFIDDATVLARRPPHGSTVLMHPSAMLAGVILTIFLYLESVGESAACGKALIELDAEAAEEPDVIDSVGAGAREKASPATTEEEGPLLVLKQMLQQIAEAVLKQEGDRIGAHGASQGQNWGAALLSSGAVVAAIAYAQDNIPGLPGDEDMPAPSMALVAEAEHEAILTDPTEEDGTGPQGARDVVAVDVTSAPTLAQAEAEAEAVEALPEDFLLMAQVPTVASGDRTGPTEPTTLPEAVAEERLVLTDDKPNPAPREVEEARAPLSQEVEDVSVVSSLVSFMSGNTIELRDAFFGPGDLIGAVGPTRSGGSPDVAAVPLPAPLPFEPDDTFVFEPVEPQLESVSLNDIAERITDFVRITGVLGYDMTDRSNLAIYDRGVIGHRDSADIVSRSFVFQDESIVTFIGFSDELDMVFAA